MPHRSLLTTLLTVLAVANSARAELPAVEKFVGEFCGDLKEQIGPQKAVVSVRIVSSGDRPWALHEALACEITANLCRVGVDAVPSAWDHRVESVTESQKPFEASDARRIRLLERDLWLTGELHPIPKPRLQLALWNLSDGDVVWREGYDVPRSVFDISANIPELNQGVVDFCRRNLNLKVGDGICATLPEEALKAAGAKRTGIYTWGRRLDDDETILPGDILQMERVKFPSSSYSHHSAVVVEARGDELIVLHQNVRPKGQIVHEAKLRPSTMSEGQLVAYRPWTGSSPLPAVAPLRRMPAKVVQSGGRIDLYQMIDPQLDALQGIWHHEEATLRCNRDTPARLQIPVDVPDSYTLRLTVTRLIGDDQLAIGLVVGGRQTMLSIDAYHSTCSGLHLLDGRKSNDNATTWKGALLPANVAVPVEVKVTPQLITATANGKTFVEWSGDPSRLSLDERYEFPSKDRLFLAAWNTYLAIGDLTLEPIK